MTALRLACLCGEVTLSVAKTPEFIHECNCALCEKTGARWAYPAPDDVAVEGDTSVFVRRDKPEPSAVIHFCPRCGCTTHFTLNAQTIAKHGNVMMGVNVRLAEAASLAGIELRFPNGRDWPGEGAFDFVRPTVVLGG